MTLALGLLLAWGALAFGAVYPWAYSPLAIGALVAGGVGWGASRGLRRAGSAEPGWGVISALVVAMGASSAQVMPFSEGVLTRLSPSGDAFFGAQSALGSRTALSLDPLSTGMASAWLLSMTALFAGATRWFRLGGVTGVVRSVMVLGVLLALIGIVQEPVYSGALYGFWQPRFGRHPFGPFGDIVKSCGSAIGVIRRPPSDPPPCCVPSEPHRRT